MGTEALREPPGLIARPLVLATIELPTSAWEGVRTRITGRRTNPPLRRCQQSRASRWKAAATSAPALRKDVVVAVRVVTLGRHSESCGPACLILQSRR